MDRRNFFKNSLGSLSALVVGKAISGFINNPAFAAIRVQSLTFTITDAIKEMVTHNNINKATCYFWIFKEERFPADCPGPIIFTTEGEEINVSVTNALDENHAFFIKGAVNSGPIAPGETKTFSFIAPRAGTYLYYDNLNEPVNRVMGLHGALVVMPKATVAGNKFTPYSNPTSSVQKLFNDFGSDHFPGLSWEESDPDTNTPGFRQHVWVLHEASPVLFQEVGNFPIGKEYPADTFKRLFQEDDYGNTFENGKLNQKPHFFTINGQSGFLSHHNPYITPWRRVGEPVVIRTLNAGLYCHSLHIHANHFYLLAVDNKIGKNLLWLDTYQNEPMQTVDWALPCKRPPDVPNERGIGFPDAPLKSVKGLPVWPPVEEMNSFFPREAGPLAARQSPLCYPMHDHIEISQTAQGGNYNMGMMSGIVFTGDRTIPGAQDFPDYPKHYDVAELSQTQVAAPSIPHDHNDHGHHDEDIPYEDWEIQHEDHEHHEGEA